MAAILGELQRLQSVESDPSAVDSAELLAEEIAARCDSPTPYRWDSERLEAAMSLPGGVELHFVAKETESRVVLEIVWSKTGSEDYKNVQKWLVPRLDAATSALRRNGWSITSQHRDGSQRITVNASVLISAATAHLSTVVEGVTVAASEMSFT